MATIAGGIILAACILSLLPLIFSLIAVVFYGMFRLAAILIIPAIVVAAIFFGILFTQKNLLNGNGLALVAVLAVISLVYSYVKAVWDFGDLKTALSYYRLLLRRAPDLVSVQRKEDEVAKFRAYRSSVRARRKAQIAKEKAQDRLKKLHDAREQIAKSLQKFTASTDFQIETNDTEHRLELYFEGARVGSVVEAGYSYRLVSEYGPSAPNTGPRSPGQIAGEIKAMLKKRVKQMKSMTAS